LYISKDKRDLEIFINNFRLFNIKILSPFIEKIPLFLIPVVSGKYL